MAEMRDELDRALRKAELQAAFVAGWKRHKDRAGLSLQWHVEHWWREFGDA